ncbi:MAG TPA: hypothetical protein VFD70_13400 [Anaerolineae bacterium]|nr:hypothetical protein [Anaerolineae bacterium]
MLFRRVGRGFAPCALARTAARVGNKDVTLRTDEELPADYAA